MKKVYRVKSKSDFQKVFRLGESTANRQFVIYVLDKPNQAHFRVGISVGKKIGNAVMRNKVKRKIRQILLEMDQEQLIAHQKDLIVIARKPVSQMTIHEMKKSLNHVLNLAGVLSV